MVESPFMTGLAAHLLLQKHSSVELHQMAVEVPCPKTSSQLKALAGLKASIEEEQRTPWLVRLWLWRVSLIAVLKRSIRDRAQR